MMTSGVGTIGKERGSHTVKHNGRRKMKSQHYDFSHSGRIGEKDFVHVWIEDPCKALELAENIIYQARMKIKFNKGTDIGVILTGNLEKSEGDL